MNCRGTVRCSRRRLQVLSKSLGYNWCLGEESIIYKRGSELTMITEIVDQYNFLDQMFRTPVQHAEIENEFSVISFFILAKDSLNDRNKRNFLAEIKRLILSSVVNYPRDIARTYTKNSFLNEFS